MLFKDIPKYTRIGSYQVSTPLSFLDKKITEWEQELHLELNPDFQRGHVWTEEQQIAFVEYLIKGGKSAITIYFNHPGWMGSFKGPFVLVDGLQRITSCLKFMRNELPIFDGHYYKDFDDTLSYEVELLINVNNLKKRSEVLQWYIDFNTGGTIHTKEEIEKVKLLLYQENNK